MKSGFVVIGAILVFVGCVGGAVWLGTEGSYRLSAHYAPRFEDVRRSTFEQSRAFQEGTIRDLDNLCIEYARGDETTKAAVADTARHRFADVPIDQLPPTLQNFARQVGAY